MATKAWKRLLSALTAAVSGALLAEACSTPHFGFVDATPGAPDASVEAAPPECDSSAADCGAEPEPDAGIACDPECTNDHGSTRCVAGLCTPICASGFADCNGEPSDGCETDLSTEKNCGACGAACALTNATSECASGVCTIDKCAAGYDDCDGNAKNGCESDLSRPDTCGSCDVQCNANGGVASCTDGECGITCIAGHADCVNGLSDGCETDITGNVLHCGSCTKACPTTGGTPSCIEGQCGLSDCTSPLSDCNGDAKLPTGDGCETNTSTDVNNCGGCGVKCYFPNASSKCVGKTCQQDACAAGYADCTAANGCETALGTTSNCLACTDACNNDHGTAACGAQGCVPTCARDWGDCDNNPNNGCETPLTTLTDCSACGTLCSFTHAAASCATGTCTQGGCDAGWSDCTAAPGCETEGACPTGGGGAGGGGAGGGSGSGAGGTSASGGVGGGTGSVCAQTGFAFCDDFEDGNASGWLTSGGTWTVTTDGSFVYQGGNGSFQSVAGSTAWTDVSLIAKMKVVAFGGSSASYRAGLIARYNGSSNYYVAALDATGNLVLLRGMSAISGSTGTCTARAVGATIGAWHTLRLDVSGPAGNVTLKTYFDGTLQHSCVTTSTTSANGEIGVVTTGSGTIASFDDVRVTTP